MLRQQIISKKEAGFSLPELLVVIVILVALASISIPVFLNQKERADEASLRANLATAASFISVAISSGETTLAMNGPSPYEGRMIDYIESIGYWINSGDYWVKVAPTLDNYCITGLVGDKVLYWDTTRSGIQTDQGDECVAAYSYD